MSPSQSPQRISMLENVVRRVLLAPPALAALAIWLSTSCVLQTESIEGSQGPIGPPGVDGGVGERGATGPAGPTGPFSYAANQTDIFYVGGNVGVGTDQPAAALDVVANVNDGNGFLLATQRTDGTAKTRIRGGGDLFLETGEGPLDDFTQVVPRLTVTRDGNVGIGTTEPSATLEVQGDATPGPLLVTKSESSDDVDVMRILAKGSSDEYSDALSLSLGYRTNSMATIQAARIAKGHSRWH